MKEKSHVFPFLAAAASQHQSKKKLAALSRDCRADTTLYILQMQQSCPPPKGPREIHTVSALSLSLATIPNIAAEIPARAVLLLPPLLQEPTSISQASAVTSRGSSMACLQHSKQRNWGASGNVNFFTCVCVAGADLFCLPTI